MQPWRALKSLAKHKKPGECLVHPYMKQSIKIQVLSHKSRILQLANGPALIWAWVSELAVRESLPVCECVCLKQKWDCLEYLSSLPLSLSLSAQNLIFPPPHQTRSLCLGLLQGCKLINFLPLTSSPHHPSVLPPPSGRKGEWSQLGVCLIWQVECACGERRAVRRRLLALKRVKSEMCLPAGERYRR